METFEHRVVNGVLKVSIGERPEDVSRLLQRDCEIVAPAERVVATDLWPAVWALANVLKRQFTGHVYINCGLTEGLSAPSPLGDRCRFGAAVGDVVRVGLACHPQGCVCFGDAREFSYSVGEFLGTDCPASPLACFAVAGYLGFAALAVAAGIPPYREGQTLRSNQLPVKNRSATALPCGGFTFLGLGHLGNAYLALLFFLTQGALAAPRVHLIDGDSFQDENFATQILLDDDKAWIGQPKSHYMMSLARGFGWDASADVLKVDWGWIRSKECPSILIMGLHDFNGRRIGVDGDFDWVFDAGLNSSFDRPRISWNSLPPERRIAKTLFESLGGTPQELGSPGLRASLASSPGPCGSLKTFDDVTASAPCMGLVAAAFLFSEVLSYGVGEHTYCAGSLGLWSPILPPTESRQAM